MGSTWPRSRRRRGPASWRRAARACGGSAPGTMAANSAPITCAYMRWSALVPKLDPEEELGPVHPRSGGRGDVPPVTGAELELVVPLQRVRQPQFRLEL